MSSFGREFQEIGHSGGQYTVNVKTVENGRKIFQLGVRHTRPTPISIFAVYFLPQGIPIGMINLGGIGQSGHSSPVQGCFQIFIASDTHSMFGHECESCKGYWRSNGAPSQWKMTCPYCGLRSETHTFLTEGQTKYATACCNFIQQAIASGKDGESVIDMDQIVDSSGKTSERPKFYYAEQTQQNKYTCQACGESNDILGRYGYCSCCGTYNGFYELECEINQIREKIIENKQYETCVKNAVAAFDSYARQIAKQLAKRIPMVPSRQKQWEQQLFHNLKPCADSLKAVFDIAVFKNLKQEDIDFIILMFHRRHIYEHNGGEVDERYIRESGDTSVRPKQVIHEFPQTVTRTLDLILRMAHNIHEGFHLIFPPEGIPIRFKKGTSKVNKKDIS